MNPPCTVSVVLPVYNNALELTALHKRLTAAMQDNSFDYDLVFVDDKSADGSRAILKSLAEKDGRITVIALSRNFGQPGAIAAGLDYAKSGVVVIMDADLQDRPEDIPRLIEKLISSGASMAVAKTDSREDNLPKIIASGLFNIVSNCLTNLRLEKNLRNFRAVRKEILDKLKPFSLKTATPISLLHWIGTDYITVELPRDVRFAGKSSYTFGKMMRLFFNRFFTYGKFPARIFTLGCILIGLLLLPVIKCALETPNIYGMIRIITLSALFSIFVYIGIIGEIFLRDFRRNRSQSVYEIAEIFTLKSNI
jgi:polyisoprenyl-phosphate glycosyltransferase